MCQRRVHRDRPGLEIRASPVTTAVLGWDDGRVARTVLIVDDHAGFRTRARAVLEAAGFDVVGEAGDGASAIAEAGRLRPDVVLLDIRLPDLDGFDVARRLVQKHAPVVVLVSSRDASDYGTRIEQSPAAGFIPKAELSGAALEALLEAS
jgi:DNA-binding NarL/FixJ family response regulator